MPTPKPETLATLRVRHLREESALVRAALRQAGGNVLRAAEALGVSRSTLQSMVQRLNLSDEARHEMGRPVEREE